MSLWSIAPATKKWCQVIQSASPVTQNHLSKPTDLMLQNATSSGNQRPHLLTSLMNMSPVLRLPRKMHLCRSSSNVPRLPSFLEMLQNLQVLLSFKFWQGAQSLAPAMRNDIWTSKSAPYLSIYLMLQNVTPLRKSAPSPSNISDGHVVCIAPATENASLQILFKRPTTAIVFGNARKPSRFAHVWQGAESLAPATRNDIWTSNSGPNMWCF